MRLIVKKGGMYVSRWNVLPLLVAHAMKSAFDASRVLYATPVHFVSSSRLCRNTRHTSICHPYIYAYNDGVARRKYEVRLS